MNCNNIEQVTVSSLMDGRYFFIPSYQRGYRWNKKQIYDLCNDLLEYVLKERNKHNENGSKGSFYSLQPLIVRKDKYNIAGDIREAYEVIDGQQRLTTIFILYRYLANDIGNGDWNKIYKYYRNRTLYHIYYETRPNDYSTLEKSGFEPLEEKDITNIDIAHIANAYKYIDNWLYNYPEDDHECANATFSLFSDDEYTSKTVIDLLFNLLDNRNTVGSVQFIWYELGGGKDAIKEFLSENKGKIRLTDTEKIKALFMRRSNFVDDSKNLKQLSIAKDWELIENTLHRNGFWSFISKDTHLEDGRINVIFDFIFDSDSVKDSFLKDGDYLFRYYYQKFARIKCAENTANAVDEEWSKVMDCFRMLQNWYYNPKVYNLVGLLVKHGYSVKQIYDIYNAETVMTIDDFIRDLNKEICKRIINGISICIFSEENDHKDLGLREGERYINLFFNVSKHKAMMPDLFRFLNVREMNKTIDKALEDIDKDDDQKKRSDIMRSARDVLSHIYRFPYEALDVFGWDIEHIDSATTNNLTEKKEQEVWLSEAEDSLNLKENNDYKYLQESLNDSDDSIDALKRRVNWVREFIGENESEICKNWIGNLTLLDTGTNRSYKNKIFVWKSNVVSERIASGVFVPVCTRNIFNKNFEGCSNGKISWNMDDKRAYHRYILNEIDAFKNEYGDEASKENEVEQ